MKRIKINLRFSFLLILLSLPSVFCGTDENTSKMGVLLKRHFLHEQGHVLSKKALDHHGRIQIIIEGNNPASAVKRAGGTVESVFSNRTVARVTRQQIMEIAACASVNKIRMARPAGRLNDRGVSRVRADLVHQGQAPLNRALTGKNVIVGIIDTGIDLDHPDFQNADGTTRVLYLWDQSSGSGNGPEGFQFQYGTEWTAAQINSGAANHRDMDGHGTHVAGTAAGNGRVSSLYKGAAPEAGLIIVSNSENPSDADIVNAAQYIFSKADQLGLPCVINASLGWHLGPHDPSDLVSEWIDELLDDKTGRFFCAAAGNEGSDFIHLSYPEGNDSLWTYVHADDFEYIDIYIRVPNHYLETVRFAIGVDESNYNPYTGTGGPLQYLGRTAWFTPDSIKRAEGRSIRMDFEGSRRGRVSFTTEAVSDSVTGLLITIEDNLRFNENNQTFTGLDLWRFMVWNGNPRMHAWIADIGYTYSKTVNDSRYHYPDNAYSVGMPATGRHILAVGASTTRTEYLAADGGTYTLEGIEEDMASFSSQGPSADGRQKPEITAPGHALISSLSRDADGEYGFYDDEIMPGRQYAVSSGTSMSSPLAAGCVALYMEMHPNAGHQEIRQAIINSAAQDAYTGSSLPDFLWGWGKLDAFEMFAATSVYESSTAPGIFELNQNYPNPFNAQTKITYFLDNDQPVYLTVYDITGRVHAVLQDGLQPRGRHEINIDAAGWPTGIYFYRLKTGNRQLTKKMALIR